MTEPEEPRVSLRRARESYLIAVADLLEEVSMRSRPHDELLLTLAERCDQALARLVDLTRESRGRRV